MTVSTTDLHQNKDCVSLDTTTLLAAAHDESSAISSSMKAFLSRVQAVTWNRRLFRADGQSFGLLPEEMKWGDHLCILFNCDVPILLRNTRMGCKSLLGRRMFMG
jgi:hypothetical protein